MMMMLSSPTRLANAVAALHAATSCRACGRAPGGDGASPNEDHSIIESLSDPPLYAGALLLSSCGHLFCGDCWGRSSATYACPFCQCAVCPEPQPVIASLTSGREKTAPLGDTNTGGQDNHMQTSPVSVSDESAEQLGALLGILRQIRGCSRSLARDAGVGVGEVLDDNSNQGANGARDDGARDDGDAQDGGSTHETEPSGTGSPLREKKTEKIGDAGNHATSEQCGDRDDEDPCQNHRLALEMTTTDVPLPHITAQKRMEDVETLTVHKSSLSFIMPPSIKSTDDTAIFLNAWEEHETKGPSNSRPVNPLQNDSPFQNESFISDIERNAKDLNTALEKNWTKISDAYPRLKSETRINAKGLISELKEDETEVMLCKSWIGHNSKDLNDSSYERKHESLLLKQDSSVLPDAEEICLPMTSTERRSPVSGDCRLLANEEGPRRVSTSPNKQGAEALNSECSASPSKGQRDDNGPTSMQNRNRAFAINVRPWNIQIEPLLSLSTCENETEVPRTHLAPPPQNVPCKYGVRSDRKNSNNVPYGWNHKPELLNQDSSSLSDIRKETCLQKQNFKASIESRGLDSDDSRFSASSDKQHTESFNSEHSFSHTEPEYLTNGPSSVQRGNEAVALDVGPRNLQKEPFPSQSASHVKFESTSSASGGRYQQTHIQLSVPPYPQNTKLHVAYGLHDSIRAQALQVDHAPKKGASDLLGDGDVCEEEKDNGTEMPETCVHLIESIYEKSNTGKCDICEKNKVRDEEQPGMNGKRQLSSLLPSQTNEVNENDLNNSPERNEKQVSETYLSQPLKNMFCKSETGSNARYSKSALEDSETEIPGTYLSPPLRHMLYKSETGSAAKDWNNALEENETEAPSTYLAPPPHNELCGSAVRRNRMENNALCELKHEAKLPNQDSSSSSDMQKENFPPKHDSKTSIESQCSVSDNSRFSTSPDKQRTEPFNSEHSFSRTERGCLCNGVVLAQKGEEAVTADARLKNLQNEPFPSQPAFDVWHSKVEPTSGGKDQQTQIPYQQNTNLHVAYDLHDSIRAQALLTDHVSKKGASDPLHKRQLSSLLPSLTNKGNKNDLNTTPDGNEKEVSDIYLLQPFKNVFCKSETGSIAKDSTNALEDNETQIPGTYLSPPFQQVLYTYEKGSAAKDAKDLNNELKENETEVSNAYLAPSPQNVLCKSEGGSNRKGSNASYEYKHNSKLLNQDSSSLSDIKKETYFQKLNSKISTESQCSASDDSRFSTSPNKQCMEAFNSEHSFSPSKRQYLGNRSASARKGKEAVATGVRPWNLQRESIPSQLSGDTWHNKVVPTSGRRNQRMKIQTSLPTYRKKTKLHVTRDALQPDNVSKKGITAAQDNGNVQEEESENETELSETCPERINAKRCHTDYHATPSGATDPSHRKRMKDADNLGVHVCQLSSSQLSVVKRGSATFKSWTGSDGKNLKNAPEENEIETPGNYQALPLQNLLCKSEVGGNAKDLNDLSYERKHEPKFSKQDSTCLQEQNYKTRIRYSASDDSRFSVSPDKHQA